MVIFSSQHLKMMITCNYTVFSINGCVDQLGNKIPQKTVEIILDFFRLFKESQICSCKSDGLQYVCKTAEYSNILYNVTLVSMSTH